MAETTTIAFYADTDIKALLEKWADEEDRSVSNILRRLILQEQKRRAAELPVDQTMRQNNEPELPGLAALAA